MEKIFKLRIILALSFIFLPSAAYAQFYATGDEPGSVRWSQITTDDYRVIFPEGLDSLAKVYARKLQASRDRVGSTAGYLPGESYRRPLPVLLHMHSAYSNGYVVWTPQRMELYTNPDSYSAVPSPWEDHLVLHESRHAAQMQFGKSHALKPFNWFFGEMASGLFCGLYVNKDFLEGDAVISETALTVSGRGRTASFLNYFMIAYDQGKWRSWIRWKGGSQRYSSPNDYALGYLYYSGLRYFYDAPDAGGRLLRAAAKKPYDFNVTNRIAREITGKNRSEAFEEIAEKTYHIWKSNADTRGPFMPLDTICRTPGFYTTYFGNVMDKDGTLYSVKSSRIRSAALISTDAEGNEKYLMPFNSSTSRLRYSAELGCIFWSELRMDPRWEHRSHSLIRFLDMKDGKVHDLTHKGKLFNPGISPDGLFISATEYPEKGGSALVILSPHDGRRIQSIPAPDSLQIQESVWMGEHIYINGISGNGSGIYRIRANDSNDRKWETVLKPQPVIIKALDTHGNGLCFVSDLNGSEEFYSLMPQNGKLLQISSTRYGASDFQFSPDGKWLYFSAEEFDGKLLCRTPADSLLCREADFMERYHYPIADGLTSQEEARGEKMVREEDVTISETKPYGKASHLFNFHSWAPLYVNVNEIMNGNLQNSYRIAAIGLTGISQNVLGSAVSTVGYSFHRDPNENGNWRHAGHFSFKYSGFYPVFELSLDFNDRAAVIYDMDKFIDTDKPVPYVRLDQKPSLLGKMKMYVPLDLSSGGWTRSIVPQISWDFNNDSYNRSEEIAGAFRYPVEKAGIQSFSASIRAGSMMMTGLSSVYPRWGAGTELGVRIYPDRPEIMAPQGYAYVYGYCPGIVGQQGLKLSVLAQRSLCDNSRFNVPAVSTLPRGIVSTVTASELTREGNLSARFTADYAIPIWLGDLGIGSMFYIRRFVLTPHFDLSAFKTGSLWSGGCSLTLDLRSFFWLKYPVSLGADWSFNGGSLFDGINGRYGVGRNYFAPIFSISF